MCGRWHRRVVQAWCKRHTVRNKTELERPQGRAAQGSWKTSNAQRPRSLGMQLMQEAVAENGSLMHRGVGGEGRGNGARKGARQVTERLLALSGGRRRRESQLHI